MLSRSCPIPLPSTMSLTAWNEGGDGRGWKGMGGDGRGWKGMGGDGKADGSNDYGT